MAKSKVEMINYVVEELGDVAYTDCHYRWLLCTLIADLPEIEQKKVKEFYDFT